MNKEKETTKPRKYTLNLSDADVESLARQAGEYNVTISEFLEKIITERYFEIYNFGFQSKKSLIAFLCVSLWHDTKSFLQMLDSIENIETNIHEVQKEIKHQKKDWKDFCTGRYDESTDTVIYYQTYTNNEEYIDSLKSDLAEYQEDLAEEKERLEELKKEFHEYMEDKPYTWEAEVQAFLQWNEACMLKTE